ncbi:MAG: hypothetical protein RR705_00165 [Lachnospiraceae bacterium]
MVEETIKETEVKEMNAESQQAAVKDVDSVIAALKELGFKKEEEAISHVIEQLV